MPNLYTYNGRVVRVGGGIARNSGGSSDITPSLIAEYVDASGTFQRTTIANDGSTTISGLAPFLVHFDASGTRLPTAFADQSTFTDEEAYVAWKGGFRMGYGESLGTTWTYGLYNSRDEDLGGPIFGHPYETSGTRTTRLRIRDELSNETTISFTVSVTAQSVTRHIPISDGAWGTISSNSHYTLEDGGNYLSWGPPPTNGLHNVLFSRQGSGALPRMSLRPSNWSLSDLTTTRSRSRHIRTLNVDVEEYYSGMYGELHCGVIRGRLRTFDAAGHEGDYGSATTNTQRSQIMYPRGVFWYDTGELNNPSGSDYVMISCLRHWHAQGVRFHRNAGSSGNHVVRNVHRKCTWRNSQLYASVATVHPVKDQALEWRSGNGAPTPWELDSELVGPVAGGNRYPYPNSWIIRESCVYGQSGDSQPTFVIASGPQSPASGDPDEGHEFSIYENGTSTWTGMDISVGGRFCGKRNMTGSGGTHMGLNTSYNSGNIPPGWDGPYINETTNTRPVPSSF